MSSNASQTLSEEDILNEELGVMKEVNAKPITEDNKHTLPSETAKEQPLNEYVSPDDVISTQQEAEINDYFTYLAGVFAENQKKQSERARDIVENGNYTVSTVDGGSEKLTYHKLNRAQDVEVRRIQRQYNKIRLLSEKFRNSFRDPKTDKRYEEFKIADFVSSPLLKGKLDGNATRETVAEVLDEEYERIFSERFDIFTRNFFGLTEEQIEKYVYKDLTYLADVAYSEYTATPY